MIIERYAQDDVLEAEVVASIKRSRQRRGIFCMLSILIVFCEIGASIAMLIFAINNMIEETLIFSAVSTLVLTVDVSLAVRERAQAHHTALTLMLSVLRQMQNPSSAVLHQQLQDAKSVIRLSYIDGALDLCTEDFRHRPS